MYTPFDDDPSPAGIDWEPKFDVEMDYESDEYYDEQGRRVMEIDYSKMEYTGPAANAPVYQPGGSSARKGKKKRPKLVVLDEIRYTMDDMTPTIRDPRCASTTDLACFWPVYVGNFKGNDVAKYFASHGLHARWWYRRNDQYYMEFQCRAGLYDMLVYFVSPRDAELAVERCHRDTHLGYTINVFPGREPIYFKEDRSVYAERMKSGRIYSEHFFEKHVRLFCKVEVSCVVKFDLQNGALEFERPEDVQRAQRYERMLTYKPVREKLRKQRYLEQDVIRGIEIFLAENPDALAVKKEDNVLRMLLRGYAPFIDKEKKYRVKPLRRGPPKHKQRKLLQRKLKKKYKRAGH